MPTRRFFVGEILLIHPIGRYLSTLMPWDKLQLFKVMATNVQLFHFLVQGTTWNVEFIHDRFNVAVMAGQCIADDVLFEMAKLICQ